MWGDQNEICPENKNESPEKHKNIISFTLFISGQIYSGPLTFSRQQALSLVRRSVILYVGIFSLVGKIGTPWWLCQKYS